VMSATSVRDLLMAAILCVLRSGLRPNARAERRAKRVRSSVEL